MALINGERLLKIIPIIVFAICSAALSYSSEKIIPLTNLNTPKTIVMDDERIYIEYGSTIKLFDATDFEFVKTFGRDGQGPGEFQDFANPQILPDYILVSGTNKVAYFSKTGNFIKEKDQTLSRNSERRGKQIFAPDHYCCDHQPKGNI